MPTKKRDPDGHAKKPKESNPNPESWGTVYDERKIGEIFDARRIALKMSRHAVCKALGWHKSEYSRKYRGLTPLSVLETSKLHALMDGWFMFPYVVEAVGRSMEGLQGRLSEILEFLALPEAAKSLVRQLARNPLSDGDARR